MLFRDGRMVSGQQNPEGDANGKGGEADATLSQSSANGRWHGFHAAPAFAMSARNFVAAAIELDIRPIHGKSRPDARFGIQAGKLILQHFEHVRRCSKVAPIDTGCAPRRLYNH